MLGFSSILGLSLGKGCHQFWFLICIFFSFCRIGEAANPGPALGTFNPTGLHGKAHLVASLPEGVYGFSESHITRVGAMQFRHELRYQNPNLRFCHGDWAPLLSNAQVSLVVKPFGSGCAALVQHNWIKVGSFYGFAKDAKTVATQLVKVPMLGTTCGFLKNWYRILGMWFVMPLSSLTMLSFMGSLMASLLRNRFLLEEVVSIAMGSGQPFHIE